MRSARLGCNRNPTGHRAGIPFRIHAALMAVTLTAGVDLRGSAPPVKDQTQTGSCTGHGTSTAITTTCNKQGTPLPFDPSPKGIYDNGRAVERAVNTSVNAPLPKLTDDGAMPADVMHGISAFGIRSNAGPAPTYSDCTTVNVNAEESVGQLLEEATYVVVGEYAIDPQSSDAEHQVKAAHAAGYAVGYAFFVDTAFEDWVSGKTLPGAPDTSDPNGGGHWVAGVGYDTLANGDIVPILRNSWGTSYGDLGDWYTSKAWMRACWDIYVMSVRLAK